MWNGERSADEAGTTSDEVIARAHVGMAENRTPRAHVGTANENRAARPAGAAGAVYAWRELGYASILEYVERVLGYGPRVAKDRLRVARALETLPALATSLALTDDELVSGLCAAALAGDRGSGADGGAPFQIALTICEACDRGCDAQHIGRLDADDPERSWQDVPPATRRLVLRRDRGCCTVPGCRSSRWLLVFGPGSAPPSAGPVIIAANEPGDVDVEVDAIDAEVVISAERALTALGFRLRDARAAIARVRAHVGTSGEPDTDPLERLVRAALRDLAPATVIPAAPA